MRSVDGFTFDLDVSQIIHIPRNYAPRSIARFGGVEALVTQMQEPTIGNLPRCGTELRYGTGWGRTICERDRHEARQKKRGS